LDTNYTYNVTGSGVSSYVIDTGILLTHQDFGGRAVTGFDAITSGGTATDCNGHGTHVAGTMGGTTWGVAKATKLYAVRVLDCNGSGTNTGVIAGVDWVTANHLKPAVANMSLGGGASTALDDAVSNSIAAGVSYSVAAGNGDRLGRQVDACTVSPARVPNAMTIGATTNTDAKTSWSNYGNCVDFFAPGASITSAWYTSNTATNTISGTSMAAPHVAGVAALYLESNPGATPQQVRDALYNETTKGIVTSSSTTNNHLLYSPPAGFGSGGGTTPPANVAPTAAFTYSCSGLTCNFTDASTDTDGSIASRAWAFGDGGTSTAQNPSHSYTAGGTYTVTLTVTDNGGATNSTSKSVAVTAPSTGGISLTASGSKVQGRWSADLSWTGSSSVDVYRTDLTSPLAISVNGSSYVDQTNFRGGGSLTYKVCAAGTDTCSNNASVTF
jgi:subtilisin family serine protease